MFGKNVLCLGQSFINCAVQPFFIITCILSCLVSLLYFVSDYHFGQGSRRMSCVLSPRLAILLLFISSSTFLFFKIPTGSRVDIYSQLPVLHGCHSFPHPLEDVKFCSDCSINSLSSGPVSLLAFVISFSWCWCPCDNWCFLIVLFAVSLLWDICGLFLCSCAGSSWEQLLELGCKLLGGGRGMGRAFLWLVCLCGWSEVLFCPPKYHAQPCSCLETAAGSLLIAVGRVQ